MVASLSKEELRRMNRELMPSLAELVDEVRKQFPQAKLIYGKEIPKDPDMPVYEVGRQGADRLKPQDLIPRRVDE